ncbi:50S ribosomal protein L11 methyltransferase [Odoribacter laneus]|uniref:Ribosomal protein L11 methyltransferase n=1 Tax=Odoribacter laneus YIT 12061 TaxID=742817 RepID=H1DJ83_9BACT|nr:50S ribosomal protein L11 methyltransferase [Odoribacter laneus]EHP46338.1 ribosomal protein L11 methyltransferase [Odoribacter laneus YIT 12061]
MDYTAINFNITPFSEEIADILIATMSSIGYEGFQYTDTGFTAYITCEQFEEERIQKLEILQSLAVDYQIDWNFYVLQDRDWNLEWEKNFTPIVVDNRILIRAGFHPTIPGIDYDIIIEPKMSFGTGHHPTTTLMLETLLDFSGQMKGKRVLDMGCGTGILSILAAKLGASTVTGIDIDEWSYRNARENIENNQLQNIQIKIGNAGLLEKEKEFDFILANINRNILLTDMPFYERCLKDGGILIMSGFYTKDLPSIRQKAAELGMTYGDQKMKQNWVAVSFTKNKQFVEL